MEKIYIPIELFNKLPSEDADSLQMDLMNIYFKNNPDILNRVIQNSEGDPDKLEAEKEKEFEKVMTEDYAFDIDILRRREDDEISQRLVEEIDKYNHSLENK